jgi:hypothetical protein
VTKPKTLSITAPAFNTLVKSDFYDTILGSYLFAEEQGLKFNLAHIPNAFKFKTHELIDPNYMTALFELGRADGRLVGNWQHLPPRLAAPSGLFPVGGLTQGKPWLCSFGRLGPRIRTSLRDLRAVLEAKQIQPQNGLLYTQLGGEWRIVGKHRSVPKNTGWKPMLYWSSGLPSDLSEPSWELSPCTWSSDATALMIA